MDVVGGRVDQNSTQDLIFTCEEDGSPIDILFSKLKSIFFESER